jgi:hypothetical protein
MNRAGRTAILSQIERYARSEKTEAVILLSNRAVQVPREIEGKPAYFVSMGRAWL